MSYWYSGMFDGAAGCSGLEQEQHAVRTVGWNCDGAVRARCMVDYCSAMQHLVPWYVFWKLVQSAMYGAAV